ncbi:MAG: phage scaffolding protein [Bacillota bacterium]|nr:phage scaffolding protein [Bacillota bacterium]
MKKEDFISLGLDEAAAQKCADASAEELKGFIPKTRFDEVNDAKKQLEKDVAARDTQLETLKTSTGDVETLKKQITDLQAQNATDKATYEAEVNQMKVDSIVERSLIAAKAKSTVAAKALLADFLGNAEFDGDSIKGLDEAVKKLTQSDDTKFLFDTDTKGKPNFKGILPGEKKDGQPGSARPATLADAVKSHFESNE